MTATLPSWMCAICRSRQVMVDGKEQICSPCWYERFHRQSAENRRILLPRLRALFGEQEPKLPPTLWRYVFPAEKGQGWCVFVLGSDGFFAGVSDIGNYAYWFAHHGRDDFRRFMIDAERDWDYFARTFDPSTEYDPDRTLQSVKETILQKRRDGVMSAALARAEWKLLGHYDELDTEHQMKLWAEETKLDVVDAVRRSRNRRVVAFVRERIATRLVPKLREELAAKPAPLFGPDDVFAGML